MEWVGKHSETKRMLRWVENWNEMLQCFYELLDLTEGGKKRHLLLLLMNKYSHRGTGWKRKFLRVFFWLKSQKQTR